MSRWTVTRVGVAGPGAGGHYTYSVRAKSADEAVEKAATKANRLHHRINRGGTTLAATPVTVHRIKEAVVSGTPAWLKSQLEDRARTATALGSAADQMNVCRSIAADLNAKGQDHTADPFWQAAVAESHRLQDEASTLGLDIHDIGEEAARRR